MQTVNEESHILLKLWVLLKPFSYNDFIIILHDDVLGPVNEKHFLQVHLIHLGCLSPRSTSFVIMVFKELDV